MANEPVNESEIFIAMRHPETGGVQKVALSSYKATWASRGWQRVTADTATADQLKEAADLLGVDVSGVGAKKADLSAAINPDEAPAATTTDAKGG